MQNRLQTIESCAFGFCNSLKVVNIPESVTKIDINAFYDCTSLSAIEVNENNKSYASVDGILYNKEKTKLITYFDTPERTDFTILSSVESINGVAFSGCKNLKNIYVSENNPYFYSVDGVLFYGKIM